MMDLNQGLHEREKRIRRAAAACYRCHARKVRCDAAALGYPCTNCALDGINNCTLRPNATARFKKLSKTSGIAVMPPPQDNPSQHTHSNNLEEYPLLSAEETISHDSDVAHQTEPAFVFDMDITNELPGLYNADSTQLPVLDTAPSFPGENFLNLEGLSSLPMSVIHILSTNKCLEIPSKPALDVFIRKYFLLIHPLVPILDEAQFWSSYLQLDESPGYTRKMSLFVFQAMLLASCTFVPLETVHQCGFHDIHGARRALYNRAKIIYDTNFESDPLARAQGALLLTFHTTAEDPQATMTWNICAIQNAISAGLDQNLLRHDPDAPAKKRLWWSVFVRDRILWLGRHRRPPFISANFNIKINYLEETDFSDEIVSSPVYTPEAKRLVVKLFQAQCRLAVILTDVVSTAFSAFDTFISRLSPEDFGKSLNRVRVLKYSLARWREEIQMPLDHVEGPRPESLDMLNHLTWMNFQSARIALNHHEILLVQGHLDMIRERSAPILLSIAQDLKDAMFQMSKVMAYFASNNLTENIPLSALAYCGTPMVLSAIDVTLSPTYSESLQRRRVLDDCSKVISQSRGLYDVTEFFSQGTNHILQLADAITKNLFIEGNKEQNNDSTLNPSANGNLCGDIADRPERALVPIFKGLRINGWIEAFLKYPLAYLLISTCIDHSLATGRLPEDKVLPPLVRGTVYMILGAPKLPWTINIKDTRKKKYAEENNKVYRDKNNSVSNLGFDDTWYLTLLHGEQPVQSFDALDSRRHLVEEVDEEVAQNRVTATNFDPATESTYPGDVMSYFGLIDCDTISDNTDSF